VNTESEDIVGILHHATTAEDAGDWKDLVHVLMRCRVCELAVVLQLLVVTICECSLNRITDPNPVGSYSYTWQCEAWYDPSQWVVCL
jgi:hypothetical protein